MILVYIDIYIEREGGEREKERKISWPTVVEGDPKVPFSIATTPRCGEGRYSFSLDCSTYPSLYFIMQEGIKYHFLSHWYDSTWD